jgi:16S rRNA (cytidine1402-2'-O)-methyltransferase
MTSPGTLYLIPTPLGEGDLTLTQPAGLHAHLNTLHTFIVEQPKTARQHLKRMGYARPLQEAQWFTLNQHTRPGDINAMLAPLRAGTSIGLLSDAGCPGVADPGAIIVAQAHALGAPVQPLVGPSSLLLTLMASGANGQRFCFHGYLPVPQAERDDTLRQLELRSRQHNESQLFIETPYRNDALLRALLQHCHRDTLICTATDLTLPTEQIISQPRHRWPDPPPVLGKRPTVFLMYAGKITT